MDYQKIISELQFQKDFNNREIFKLQQVFSDLKDKKTENTRLLKILKSLNIEISKSIFKAQIDLQIQTQKQCMICLKNDDRTCICTEINNTIIFILLVYQRRSRLGVIISLPSLPKSVILNIIYPYIKWNIVKSAQHSMNQLITINNLYNDNLTNDNNNNYNIDYIQYFFTKSMDNITNYTKSVQPFFKTFSNVLTSQTQLINSNIIKKRKRENDNDDDDNDLDLNNEYADLDNIIIHCDDSSD